MATMTKLSDQIQFQTRPLTASDQPVHDDPLLDRIYRSRGIKSATEIEYAVDKLPSYKLLKGHKKAIEIIAQHLIDNKHILIVGDFDADGATSTALLYRFLREVGGKHISYEVPNRFKYGYGLSKQLADDLLEKSADLIITVDCGISSHEGVAHAKSHGLSVVITDHHLPPSTLPEADAIVNPNQPGCTFPSKNIAGVGVVFFLLIGLRAYLRHIDYFHRADQCEPRMVKFLDLVALGTSADVVELDYVNRLLIDLGLRVIRANSGSCAAISSIMATTGKNPRYCKATDLNFAIGPRLNAAGRLEDMSKGVACLIASNPETADAIAYQLSELNHKRKLMEESMLSEIQANAAQCQDDGDLIFTVFNKSFHQGIIGLLASRLKSQLNKPVFVFTQVNDHEIKASARSVTGFHIRDFLEDIAVNNPHILQHFGGHAMAAGLTINVDAFDEFVAIIKAKANDFTQVLGQRENIVITDGELQHHDFTLQAVRTLNYAGPWGQGFPEPVFHGYFIARDTKPVGEKHLKIIFNLPDLIGVDINAIMFNTNFNDTHIENHRMYLAIFTLNINEFRNHHKVQIIVSHITDVTAEYNQEKYEHILSCIESPEQHH